MFFFEGWYLPDGEKKFSAYLEAMKDGEFPMQYQAPHRNLSLSHVTKFNTAIDVGACVGFWSKDLCRRFNKTICFEPYPKSADCLIKNLQEYKNYELFDVALSNQSGPSKLFVSEVGVGANSLYDPAMASNPSIDIETKRLDDYGFANVDYIKIDVQFFELQVLQGAVETLKFNDPLVCIECARRTEEELEYVVHIVKFMKDLGYLNVGGYNKELFFKKKRNSGD